MNKIVLLNDHTDEVQFAYAGQLIKYPHVKWIENARYASLCVYKYHYPDNFADDAIPNFFLTDLFEMESYEVCDEFVLYVADYLEYMDALMAFQANHLEYRAWRQ